MQSKTIPKVFTTDDIYFWILLVSAIWAIGTRLKSYRRCHSKNTRQKSNFQPINQKVPRVPGSQTATASIRHSIN